MDMPSMLIWIKGKKKLKFQCFWVYENGRVVANSTTAGNSAPQIW